MARKRSTAIAAARAAASAPAATSPAARSAAAVPARNWYFLEASAGTGKTEKIQTLLLERILDPRRDVEVTIQKSLLVSFTEAAAAELRARIQGTLTHVVGELRACAAGRAAAYRNKDLQAVVVGAAGTDADKIDRLTTAQAKIDRLTIGTIHSFCKQLLNRYPIDCGKRTGLVIASDLSEIAAEASADAFAELLHTYDAAGQWPLAFSGNSLKDPDPERLAKLAKGVVSSDLPIYPAMPSLHRAGGLLTQRYEDIVTWFAHQVRNRVDARNQALGLISLTDLIRIVDHALSKNASSLASTLQGEWDLIILDEAQDTDAAQWRILQTLAGPAGEFFAVGDPKQSIFSFRGAHYNSLPPLQGPPWQMGSALTTNYRSDAPLLNSLNLLYGNGALQHFSPVTPAHACRLHSGPVGTANTQSGLYFHVAQPPANGTFKPRHTWAEVAEGILQELDAKLQIGATDAEQSTLGPGDVAVLVRYNRTAEEIRAALVARGIPVAAASQASVLDSDELREMAAVFAAIDAPYHERVVAAAAMTRLIGFDNAKLNKMLRDGDASSDRQELVVRLAELRERLALHGIAEVVEEIFDERWIPMMPSARERILGEPDGERAMKNFMDVAALLVKTFWRRGGAAAVSTSISAWLLKASARATARELGGDEDDAFSVSLETDSDAVRIMTVHAAKGRQFGSVWLPEACTALTANKYYDRGQPYRTQPADEIVLEPQADPAVARPQAIVDAIHEELRLLYVAGTRAKHRTHVVLGCFDLPDARSVPRLPLGHLIAQSAPANLDVNPPAFFNRGNDAALGAELVRIQAAAKAIGGRVEIVPLPAVQNGCYKTTWPTAPSIPADTFSVPGPMRLTSFSSLSKLAKLSDTPAADVHDEEMELAVDDIDTTARHKPDDETYEDDVPRDAAGGDELPGGPGGGTPLAIPRDVLAGGKKQGDLVHKVLEFVLRMTEPVTEAALGSVITAIAAAEGVTDAATLGSKLAPPLHAALSQPLRGPFDTCALVDLAQHGIVTTELPFTIGLELTEREKYDNLHAVFVKHERGDFKGFADHLARLKRTDVRGVFNGLIDLIWRKHDDRRVAIIDYKTNVYPRSAPPALEAYTRDRLAVEMTSSHYLLQAALYAAVADAWLRSIDADWNYDRDFAGVSFTFLRAMGPHFADQKDNAVFHVTVPHPLVCDLAATLRFPGYSAAAAIGGTIA
jgi:exodeoxyribonuclease V beta subunit